MLAFATRAAVVLSLSFAAASCATSAPPAAAPEPPPSEAHAEAASPPSSAPTSQPTQPSTTATHATPSDEAVSARVAEAAARLSTTPGGERVAAAIGAHGGLERWFANGPLAFRFRYAPREGRDPIDTIQLIDTFSARAAHRLTADPTVRFGWDGQTAWVTDPEAELGTNPRFWSLTPYYFVGVPFVLADPGVQLAPDGEEIFEDRTYDRVRATFGAGVGDAPDDYYVVLIDQETHRVGGVRYVVSYPGFFPDGGHSPEKLMVYDGAQVIDGVTFPTTFRTFTLDDQGAPDAVATDSEMSAVSFAPDTVVDAFAVPEGATTLPGY